MTSAPSNPETASELERAETADLARRARHAAINPAPQDTHLADLDLSLRQSTIPPEHHFTILLQAWEESVQTTLENGLLSQDQEKSLSQYLHHYHLTHEKADRNGAHTLAVYSAILRELTEGHIYQHYPLPRSLPIAMAESETLVWATNNVAYLASPVPTADPTSIHEPNSTPAPGGYRPPSAFPVADEQLPDATDTGLLALTDRNIHFAGSKHSLRIPYASIAGLVPESYGFNILQKATDADHQSFRTSNNWFTYNLATILLQHSTATKGAHITRVALYRTGLYHEPPPTTTAPS